MGDEDTAPARRRSERDRDWTERKQKQFLYHLSWSVNVRASARAVSMSEPSVYRLRARSTEFRAAWDVALREGYARLEVVMLERAIGGTVKPIVSAGKVTGEMTEYSDRLGLSLLAAHRAAVHGVEANPGDPASARERIAAKLAEMNRRLGGEG